MVKEFLSQRSIGYDEVDVSRDRNAAQELVSKTGRMGVPVTLINGQVIVGFDRPKLEQVLSQQKPVFGAFLADADKITVNNRLKMVYGAYVGRVKPGSVAEKIGLATNDIITSFDSQNIGSVNDFEAAFKRISRGSRFSLGYLRQGQRYTTKGML